MIRKFIFRRFQITLLFSLLVIFQSFGQSGFRKILPLEKLQVDTPITMEPFTGNYIEWVPESDTSYKKVLYSYEVNSSGKIIGEAYFSFLDDEIKGITKNKYNSANKIIESSFYPTNHPASIEKTLFYYNNKGLLATQEEYKHKLIGYNNDNSNNYKWIQTYLFDYEYDKAGNLIRSVKSEAPSDTYEQHTITYTYDKSNRIKNISEHWLFVSEKRTLVDTIVSISNYEYADNYYKEKTSALSPMGFTVYTDKMVKLNNANKIAEITTTTSSSKDSISITLKESNQYDGLGKISKKQFFNSLSQLKVNLVFYYKDNKIVDFEKRDFFHPERLRR